MHVSIYVCPCVAGSGFIGLNCLEIDRLNPLINLHNFFVQASFLLLCLSCFGVDSWAAWSCDKKKLLQLYCAAFWWSNIEGLSLQGVPWLHVKFSVFSRPTDFEEGFIRKKFTCFYFFFGLIGRCLYSQAFLKTGSFSECRVQSHYLQGVVPSSQGGQYNNTCTAYTAGYPAGYKLQTTNSTPSKPCRPDQTWKQSSPNFFQLMEMLSLCSSKLWNFLFWTQNNNLEMCNAKKTATAPPKDFQRGALGQQQKTVQWLWEFVVVGAE